jgi:hypothetical protein
MKKQFLFFLFFLPLPLLAQVTNVRAGQSGQDIVITYDLAESTEVRAYMSVGGQPFVELHSAQGDVGCVPQGINRTITWSPLAESDEFLADNVVFKVEAPHAFVDLGLPSGTLWATCNVGANAPEEFGGYFAWGEVEGKDFYSWENYKWGTRYNLTKYNSVDKLLVIEPIDDAATANWGQNWCMPSVEQWKELKFYCKETEMDSAGVHGSLFVSRKNGNSIFFPFSGIKTDERFLWGLFFEFWENSISEKNPDRAYCTDACLVRSCGRSIRPIYNKK